MLDIFHTVFKYKEKESPDILGLYPERIHTSAMPERRYLWSSRMLVIIACLSINFNLILASTMFLLLPQRSSTPRLLHLNEDFYTLEQTQPAEKPVASTDLIAEQHIDNYIRLRYSIGKDYDKLVAKWKVGSMFYWHSSFGVYQQFSNNELKNTLIQAKNKGLTRDVMIEWTRPLNVGLWQSQFITYEYLPSSPIPSITRWRANVRIAYETIPFETRNDMIKNPFGFVVTNFSLGYKGKLEDFPTTTSKNMEQTNQ